MTVSPTHLRRIVAAAGGSPSLADDITRAAANGDTAMIAATVAAGGGSPAMLDAITTALANPVPFADPITFPTRAHEQLADTGVTVIPGMFDPAGQGDLAGDLLTNGGTRILRPAGPARPELLDGGGRYDHTVADAATITAGLPWITAWYYAAIPALTDLFDAPIEPSLLLRSRYTLKHYGPGGQQGWHYDTNPVTVLLWLTTSPAEGALEVRDRTGEVRRFAPHAGSVLAMWGSELWHRVLPQPDDANRIMVALNYYLPGAQWRPDGIDDLVYGDT